MEKKYLIIILVAILAILAIGIVISIGTPHEKTYEPYNFSATCSIELPTWIKFNNGAGDLNSNSNIMGSNVASTTKALFGNNEVMQITYSHSTVDGANVGADLNDNMALEQNGKKVYTRMVMNEATGESVSVMGENEEVVNYIADHVKFNGATVNKTNTTNDTIEEDSTATTSEPSNNSNVDDANNKKYTQEDLNRARADGYLQGYDDSINYPDYGYDYGYDDRSSSSSSSESSSSSNVETTTA